MKKQELSISEFKKLSAKKGTEASLQVQICNYIKIKYPTIIFQCDLASGMNLGKKVGGMNTRLRSSRGLPDLFIAQPKFAVENIVGPNFVCKHVGLFIELKKQGTNLYKKDGITPVDLHIAEQMAILIRLQSLGYAACFGVGYDATVKIIEGYLD